MSNRKYTITIFNKEKSNLQNNYFEDIVQLGPRKRLEVKLYYKTEYLN